MGANDNEPFRSHGTAALGLDIRDAKAGRIVLLRNGRVAGTFELLGYVALGAQQRPVMIDIAGRGREPFHVEAQRRPNLVHGCRQQGLSLLLTSVL